jgi:hypothetical protein
MPLAIRPRDPVFDSQFQIQPPVPVSDAEVNREASTRPHFLMELEVEARDIVPGQWIVGRVRYRDLEKGQQLELRLTWSTDGKGTRDSMIVTQQFIPSQASSGLVEFQVQAPNWPVSFNGQMLSLEWMIQLVRLPEQVSENITICIGPDAKPIALPIEISPPASLKSRLQNAANRS